MSDELDTIQALRAEVARLTAERDAWRAAHAERSAKIVELQDECDALNARANSMYAQAVRNANEADASEARYAAALADGEQAALRAEAAERLLVSMVDMVLDGDAPACADLTLIQDGDTITIERGYADKVRQAAALLDALLAERAAR